MRGHFGAAAVGNDADRAIGEIPQQSCGGLFHMKDDGVVIGRIDVIDEAVDGGFGGADFTLKGIESPLHIARGERATVVELYAMVQVKNVGEGIGNFPTFGKAGSDIEIFAAGEEVVEDEIVDALGLGVDSDAGIEICGAGLDQHDQRVGIGLMGTRELRKT